MRSIVGYLYNYGKEINKRWLLACSGFVALLIFLNYRHSLEKQLSGYEGFPFPYFTGHALLFLLAYLVPVAFLLIEKKRRNLPPAAWVCLLLAPVLFAFKMAMDTAVTISSVADWNSYWNAVLYWPLRTLMLTLLLAILWQLFHTKENFYGLTTQKVNFTPYYMMLALMLPLIFCAAMQADFQHTYPKAKHILPLPENASLGWWYVFLYELGYGIDFFSIEIFFRGFLVIGMMKWLGKNAILPMACFYCAIHFGKPLGECISSYFGGIVLGVVAYHTRSVIGGLLVHLGIAWLMEVAGWLGNYFKW